MVLNDIVRNSEGRILIILITVVAVTVFESLLVFSRAKCSTYISYLEPDTEVYMLLLS